MEKKINYVCIVKVSDKDFVKYHVRNLINFCKFLDSKYPEWRWFNVFNSKTREQIANFTKSNRPSAPRVFS